MATTMATAIKPFVFDVAPGTRCQPYRFFDDYGECEPELLPIVCDSARAQSRCYVHPQHMSRHWLEQSKWANLRRLARSLGIRCPWFESGLTRALVVSKVYAACNNRTLPINSCPNRC